MAKAASADVLRGPRGLLLDPKLDGPLLPRSGLPQVSLALCIGHGKDLSLLLSAAEMFTNNGSVMTDGARMDGVEGDRPSISSCTYDGAATMFSGYKESLSNRTPSVSVSKGMLEASCMNLEATS